MTRPRCPWCDWPFTPRRTGGRLQRFCSERCRRRLERELRAWARQQIAEGGITPIQLQRAFEECGRAGRIPPPGPGAMRAFLGRAGRIPPLGPGAMRALP